MNKAENHAVSATRTPIGSFGGALKDVPLSQLASTAVREVIARAGTNAASIGHVVPGYAISTEPRDGAIIITKALPATQRRHLLRPAALGSRHAHFLALGCGSRLVGWPK